MGSPISDNNPIIKEFSVVKLQVDFVTDNKNSKLIEKLPDFKHANNKENNHIIVPFLNASRAA
jgi:hypothetical protein